jgi:hypothetical protein
MDGEIGVLTGPVPSAGKKFTEAERESFCAEKQKIY